MLKKINEKMHQIANNETVLKITTPIIKFVDKTIILIKSWKGVVVFVNINKMHDKAYDWMCELTQRGDASNSKDIPADLRKNNPKTILTRSGELTSGYTTPNDWSYGEDAGISQLYIASTVIGLVILNVLGLTNISSLPIPLIAGGLISMVGGALGLVVVLLALHKFNMLGGFVKTIFFLLGFSILFSIINYSSNNPIITSLAYSIPAFIMWYLSYSVDRKRGFDLLMQAEAHNSTLGERFIKHDDTANPEVIQIRNALADTSPFIEIGKTTGRMQRDGDSNAPDGGIEMGLTVKDSGQHIFIEGATGTGKSWLLISLMTRFYIYNLYQGKKFGMFLACGKADLPFQLKSIEDAIITPELIKHLNFIQGLRPEQRISILLTANDDNDNAGANQIFKNGGVEIGYFSALLQDKLLEIKHLIDPKVEKISASFNYWQSLGTKIVSPGNLDASNKLISHPIIDLLKQHPNFENDKSIEKLVNYINLMQKPTNRELIESFLANFNGWMSKITQNTRLYDWADSEESDIDIYDILKGKKYGIALNYDDYGIAGTIITQFVKASLFNKLAQRKDGWRADTEQVDVAIVLDECQDIVSKDDVDQAQKARSRGIILIYATQHKTNLENKLGEKGADALMLSFLNNIQLRTGDEKSIEFMKHKLGKIRAILSQSHQGNPIDFALTNEIAMRSPEFNSSHPEAHFIKFNGGKVQQTNKFFGSLTKDGNKATSRDSHLNYATYSYNQEQPMRDLLTPDIIKSLDVPHHAIVRVQRAGMPRNDVVKVHGMGSEESAKLIKDAKDYMSKKELLELETD